MMNLQRRKHFQTLLEGERDRIRAELGELEQDGAIQPPAAPGDESDPGVSGAAESDDEAVLAHEAVALLDVERSLQMLRSDPGRFGVCVECGRPIGDDRLELVPTTRRCARHADGPGQVKVRWTEAGRR